MCGYSNKSVLSEKEKLNKLELTDNYVFHGSSDGTIQLLEPRQGSHVPDLSKPTKIILDGKPAVSATPYVEIAIFRAMINNKNVPFSHTSGFGINHDSKEFRVSSEKVLKEIKEKKRLCLCS